MLDVIKVHVCKFGRHPMNRRRFSRHPIQVELEIATPGNERCCGHAENVSRTGICVVLGQGEFADIQRSVMLNLKIWTGSETLFRKLHARVQRVDGKRVALTFAENDLVTHAIVQDLLYYQCMERRRSARLRQTNAETPARQPPATLID